MTRGESATMTAAGQATRTARPTRAVGMVTRVASVPPRWRRSWVAVAAAVVFAAVAIPLFGRHYVFYDMRIYHGAMDWWVGGGDLYEFIAPNTTLGFTYPPFAALTMLPMASMPALAAGWVNTVASVVALGFVLAVLLMPIADRCGWPRWPAVAVAVPLALATEAGRETLGFGQVNLLLFALVIADLLALRWATHRDPVRGLRDPVRGLHDSAVGAGSGTGASPAALPAGLPAGRMVAERLRQLWFSGAWAGVGIGLATAIKLTPGLFIVYLLLSRQRRPAVVAMATAAGASLASWVVAPRESTTYFTSVLWQTDRVGAADFTPNQSLAGILARLYDSPETPGLLWLSFAALCAALGLSRAISAHKEGDELAAFTLVGLTATVISPISWTHHLVFVIPAVVVLGDAALRRHAAGRGVGLAPSLAGLGHGAMALAVYTLFVISPLWWVYHRLPDGSHYDSGLWGVLAENSLALGVILLVALLPWRPGAEPAPLHVRHFRANPGLRTRRPIVAPRRRAGMP